MCFLVNVLLTGFKVLQGGSDILTKDGPLLFGSSWRVFSVGLLSHAFLTSR